MSASKNTGSFAEPVQFNSPQAVLTSEINTEEVQAVPDHPAEPPVQRAQLRRFRFCPDVDLALLRAVQSEGAHLAQWGKTAVLFNQVHSIFLASHEYKARTSPTASIPPCKSLMDRFKKLVSERRAQNKINSAASGIAEEYEEREQLLDDIIHQMDEKVEEDRMEKAEKSEKDLQLRAAGEKIRNEALARKSARRDAVSNLGDLECGEEAPKKKRMIKKDFCLDYGNVEAEMEIIEREAEARRKMEEMRNEAEKKRIDLEERRVALEKKRFQSEMEKRKDDAEERKLSLEEKVKIIDLLAAIASKLA